MINIDLLPDDIIGDIVESLGCDRSSEKGHLLVAEMTKEEARRRFLEWNGIIGYERTIYDAFKHIDKASDEPREFK